jgi:glycosyltransferase involved in cell wall biosynthesis
MSEGSYPPVELVIYGGGLANPSVGLGVHCLNLIRALERVPRPGWDYRVLVPQGCEVETLGISARTVRRFRPWFVTGHALLDETIRWQAAGVRARSDYPRAIFHAPSMFWSPCAPVRRIVTLHDVNYRAIPRYMGRLIVRKGILRLAERYARSCERILTVSEFSRKQIVKFLRISPEQISVTYNWISSEFAAPIPSDRLAMVARKYALPGRFWLYLGGYDYRKNIEFLIAAYATARRKVSEIPPLVLAGKIPENGRNAMSCDIHGAISQAGLPADAILLPGHIDYSDVPALHRLAALFIYPSLLEGFGLPPAEAMAMGTPVLVSDGSSLPEVVRNVGCRFDPSDIGALQVKMMAAASDESQFRCVLPEEFTEGPAVARYLQSLGLSSSIRIP